MWHEVKLAKRTRANVERPHGRHLCGSSILIYMHRATRPFTLKRIIILNSVFQFNILKPNIRNVSASYDYYCYYWMVSAAGRPRGAFVKYFVFVHNNSISFVEYFVIIFYLIVST